MNRKPLILAASTAIFLAGCQSMQEFGEATLGKMDPDFVDAVVPGGGALAKSFQDLTPEQEYYIGRATAAVVLGQYKAYDQKEANDYINTLGQSLAAFSDRPETFNGYRFHLLDSDDINAFAAPGGMILVSRGMMKLCQNEEDLAAVLAHEIGHIQFQHGVKAIKRSRLTSALSIMTTAAAKEYGTEQLSALTEAFEGSINDVTSTLMNNGYGRALEYEADGAAVTILDRAGYDPRALVRVLERMEATLKPGGLDFAKTHPNPIKRVDNANKAIAATSGQATAPSKAREARFARFRAAL